MSTLHIRIEQDLYDQIKAISKSIDVSISDSINAYLRAVVQTNSLSINTRLTAPQLAPQPAPVTPAVQLKTVEPKKPQPETKADEKESTEQPQPIEKPPVAVEKPAEKPPVAVEKVAGKKIQKPRPNRAIPIPELDPATSLVSKLVTLICSIPDGLLSTWEDLEWAIGGENGAVEKPLHDEWPRTVRIPTGTDSEAGQGKSVAVPYWRVLSWAGSTKGEVTCNRDLREAMLAAEGHELVTTGRGMRIVRGYKAKLVRWETPSQK